MQPRPDQTISDIVRLDYRTADVFRKYNINFCCSGQVTMESACESKQISLATVMTDLTEATRSLSIPGCVRFNEWKISFLIDYIINLHHEYLVTAIPSLEVKIMSFIESHGKKYPEIEPVLETFRELSALLQEHTMEEEEIIFPYIRQIDDALRGKATYGALLVRTMRKPLDKNAKDHVEINRLLNQMQQQTNYYQIPEKACVTHEVLFHKLREFHDDIVQHTHLENNVLIPKAMAVEKELLDFTG
jgi:regulator of cell morphogenesis and NO signaling